MRFKYGKEIVPRRAIFMMGKTDVESVPGSVYEVRGKIKNVDKSKLKPENISVLADELSRRFGAKLEYVEVDDNEFRMQFTAGSFKWAQFLPVLPDLLQIIGVVLSTASILLVIRESTWQVFLLLVGLGLIFIGSRIRGGTGG